MFKKLQAGVGDILDFPPDVVGEAPKITIIGRQQIRVENYRQVIHFSEEEISLETVTGEICLKGQELVLKVILATELQIEGKLCSLCFGGEELV